MFLESHHFFFFFMSRQFKKTRIDKSTMNFFPNLQIHFHVNTSSRDENHSNLSRSFSLPSSRSNHISENPSSQMAQWFSNIFRQVSNANGNTTQSSPSDDEIGITDIHFYVNVDHQQETSAASRTGLTIQQIHQVCELAVMEDEQDVTCAVCQNTIDHGNIYQRIRQCHHSFHPVCIERWLSMNQTCPTCRVTFTTT